MYIPTTQMEHVFPRLRYVEVYKNLCFHVYYSYCTVYVPTYVLIHTVHTSSVILASLLYTVCVCVCVCVCALIVSVSECLSCKWCSEWSGLSE